VGRNLLGKQVLAPNFDLFLLAVAGDLDDFHAIAQRAGDGRHVVRRGQEEHLREIVGEVEEVIVEGAVLLGIEHFQHCRRRITPIVGRELIDLVEQEHGIDCSGLFHR
jgi:hypothetical protein